MRVQQLIEILAVLDPQATVTFADADYGNTHIETIWRDLENVEVILSPAVKPYQCASEELVWEDKS